MIVPIGTDEQVNTLAKEINSKLLDAGIISFVDNSEKSPGFKFAEHEVNGIPVRIEIGMRDLAENMITLARRDTREKIKVSKDCDIVTEIKDLMEKIQTNLFESAKERNGQKTYTAFTLDEVKEIMNTQPGFVKAMWCGDKECELKMKEIRGTKSRCILEEKPIGDKCVCCGKSAKHLVVWGIQY